MCGTISKSRFYALFLFYLAMYPWLFDPNLHCSPFNYCCCDTVRLGRQKPVPCMGPRARRCNLRRDCLAAFCRARRRRNQLAWAFSSGVVSTACHRAGFPGSQASARTSTNARKGPRWIGTHLCELGLVTHEGGEVRDRRFQARYAAPTCSREMALKYNLLYNNRSRLDPFF